MLNKKFIIILSIILALGINLHIFADVNVKIAIDGKIIEWTESSGRPFVDNSNRTQVPFRQAMEAFGAEVNWEKETNSAVAIKDGITVKVPIGVKEIYKNGVKIENDTAALIKNNRTYLPIRAVLEAFGAEVTWDAKSQTVNVISTKTTGNETNDEIDNTVLLAENQVEPSNKDIKITGLDKKTEYIILTNKSTSDVNLKNWVIISVKGDQRYRFNSDYILEVGKSVKIGDSARSTVDFHWLEGKGIWNNSKSDPAELYDSNGNLVDRYE